MLLNSMSPYPGNLANSVQAEAWLLWPRGQLCEQLSPGAGEEVTPQQWKAVSQGCRKVASPNYPFPAQVRQISWCGTGQKLIWPPSTSSCCRRQEIGEQKMMPEHPMVVMLIPGTLSFRVSLCPGQPHRSTQHNLRSTP